MRFWLHKLLLLDSLSYLSHGQLSLSLNRMILVDVDDIFVGEKGTRLRKDDVMALLATQQRIQALVPGFKFNLGFSGKYFHHGTAEENLGDDMLLENVDRYDSRIIDYTKMINMILEYFHDSSLIVLQVYDDCNLYSSLHYSQIYCCKIQRMHNIN